jgi:hypothetical protein
MSEKSELIISAIRTSPPDDRSLLFARLKISGDRNDFNGIGAAGTRDSFMSFATENNVDSDGAISIKRTTLGIPRTQSIATRVSLSAAVPRMQF